MNHVTEMIFGCSTRLKCGLELEMVGEVGENPQDYLSLGGYRIDWEVIDHELLDDYVLSLKCKIGSMPKTEENYAMVASHGKLLVVANAIPSSAGDLELFISSDVVVSGNLEIDTRVLGYALDAILGSARDFARILESPNR